MSDAVERSRSLAVRERYEVACDSYDELYKEEQAEKYYVALKYSKPEGVVLDAGCGTGLLAEYLESVGASGRIALYICLDYSSCMIREARRRLETLGLHYALLEASLESLPLASGSVDTVYSITVLNLLDDPVEGLRELRRVSRGPVLVTVLRESGATGPLLEEGCRLLESTSKDDVLAC
ncbi:MAG: class I SAM-dependent methyltransferase [Acidilobaceae archaeon]